jgi:hypothetical protein
MTKAEMFEKGYCYGCCAWSKIKETCMAMSATCPVPEEAYFALMLKAVKPKKRRNS